VRVSSPERTHFPSTVQVWPLRQHPPPRSSEQRKAPLVHSSLTPVQNSPMGGQLTDGKRGEEVDMYR